MALINPAKQNADVVVAAVAARDVSRAQAFAAKHGIAAVHGDYEALIADPEIDAVYNPLPNGLHGRWTRAALAAGKHVLCEKPFTANAAEAREIAELAAESDQVVMEAFHYRYHPLTRRIEDVIASGELGALRHVETVMCFPLPKFSDIRYIYSLAGGATMDVGCYTAHMARTFGGPSPEVVSAQAKLHDARVDRAMTAELRFAGGHTGRVRCSMWSPRLLQISARVVGEHGELRILNSVAPQFSIGFWSGRPMADGWSASDAGPPTPISWTLSPRRCCVASRSRPPRRMRSTYDRDRCDLSRCRSAAALPDLNF